MKRRRRNPSTAGAVASSALVATAPLLPYLALAGLAYWAWRKFMSSSLGGAAAHAASAVPEAYGQAARTALDPNQWPVAYEQAQREWEAQGGEGNPIAQPYYGPAGEW